MLLLDTYSEAPSCTRGFGVLGVGTVLVASAVAVRSRVLVV